MKSPTKPAPVITFIPGAPNYTLDISFRKARVDSCCSSRSPTQPTTPTTPCPGPHLKVMMLGCFSFRRCLMSVSFRSRTFFTATSSPWKRPRKTAPWAPEPTHCRSRISSKGTSQRSVDRKNVARGLRVMVRALWCSGSGEAKIGLTEK